MAALRIHLWAYSKVVLWVLAAVELVLLAQKLGGPLTDTRWALVLIPLHTYIALLLAALWSNRASLRRAFALVELAGLTTLVAADIMFVLRADETISSPWVLVLIPVYILALASLIMLIGFLRHSIR